MRSLSKKKNNSNDQTTCPASNENPAFLLNLSQINQLCSKEHKYAEKSHFFIDASVVSALVVFASGQFYEQFLFPWAEYQLLEDL